MTAPPTQVIAHKHTNIPPLPFFLSFAERIHISLANGTGSHLAFDSYKNLMPAHLAHRSADFRSCVDIFMRILAVCHTVLVEEKTEVDDEGVSKRIIKVSFTHASLLLLLPKHTTTLQKYVCVISWQFNANSPDEEALVQAANFFGYRFVNKFADKIRISIHGAEWTYEYSLVAFHICWHMF